MNRILMMSILLACGVAPISAWAQKATVPFTQSTTTLPPLENFRPFIGYEPMSIKALLDLYWKVGLLKPENEKAITEYIQVSDCKLYHDRFDDDFAWPETLKATRDYIKTYAPHFPTQVMTIQQIGLGRYLPDKKLFQVNEDTQYKLVERMFFADFENGRPPCSNTPFPTSAPLRAVIDIADPFSLTDIPIVSDDFARRTIHIIDDRMKAVDVNFKSRKRFAYVRLYYTVRAFRKVSQGDNVATTLQGPAIEFMGTLDGYDITADLEGQFPIYQWINPKGQAAVKTNTAPLAPSAPVPAGSPSSP